MTQPRLPVLIGATATGKTDLAVEVALSSAHPIEIVILDSRQLYRGLDIGTGKPDAEQQSAVRHHLLDILDVDATTDAMQYRKLAQEACQEILGRGAIPLLVGGAGFYLRALTDSFHELEQDPDRLKILREAHKALSDDELRNRLDAVDPESAARLHPNDRYRIGRALEIYEMHGRTATELEAEFEARPILGAEFQILQLTADRALLHQRIEGRTERWMEAGWTDEVEGLLAQGFSSEAPGLNILGYHEVGRTLRGEITREETIAEVNVRTRRYARAQETWMRKLDAVWRGNYESESARPALEMALKWAAEGASP